MLLPPLRDAGLEISLTKRILFTLIAIVLTVFAMMAIGELAVRLMGYQAGPGKEFGGFAEVSSETGWAKEDSELGWINGHGQFRSFEPPGSNIRMSFDVDGARTIPFHPHKDAVGELLIVGDSLSQGYGVKDAETYSSLLDEMQDVVHVRNYGTGGYSTYQSLLSLKKHFSGNTRYVVYGYFSQHQFRNVADFSWIRALLGKGFSFIVPPYARLGSSGALVYFPYKRITLWPFEYHSTLLRLVHQTWLRFRYGTQAAEREAVTTELIMQMKAFVDGKGANFYTVMLDASDNDRIKEILVANGVQVIDCTNESSASPEFRLGGNPHLHPNNVQHRMWASCIESAIFRQGSSTPEGAGHTK
jgi:hypothetical protein